MKKEILIEVKVNSIQDFLFNFFKNETNKETLKVASGNSSYVDKEILFADEMFSGIDIDPNDENKIFINIKFQTVHIT